MCKIWDFFWHLFSFPTGCTIWSSIQVVAVLPLVNWKWVQCHLRTSGDSTCPGPPAPLHLMHLLLQQSHWWRMQIGQDWVNHPDVRQHLRGTSLRDIRLVGCSLRGWCILILLNYIYFLWCQGWEVCEVEILSGHSQRLYWNLWMWGRSLGVGLALFCMYYRWCIYDLSTTYLGEICFVHCIIRSWFQGMKIFYYIGLLCIICW